MNDQDKAYILAALKGAVIGLSIVAAGVVAAAVWVML